MSREPRLAIRCGMDVYNVRQERYLGSVVGITQKDSPPSTASTGDPELSIAGSSGSLLVHEEGHVVGHAEAAGQPLLGEDLGPVPTRVLGNTGPVRQGAENNFATKVRDIEPNVTHFQVRPGRMNFGIFTPSFTIPTSAVLSLSMERIVVDWE